VIRKAMFDASEAAIACVASNLPGLNYDANGVGFWVWGDPLELGSDVKEWREQLRTFSRRANAIIALSDPNLSAIRSCGSIQIIDGDKCDHVMLAEPPIFESIFFPVTLSAKLGGPPPRPLAVRAAELTARQPRFEQAANILAECGEDLPKLYMVMELIERQHGKFPPKSQPLERTAFCNLIQVEEAEWAALHRTARPHRHAEPHDMARPVLTPRQARTLIQHALKLWLEREVPI
jgi:hypothetical protein